MERDEAKTEMIFIHNLPGGAHHTYTVSQNRWDMEFSEVIDDLVKPLLIASGFHPKTVEDYFNGDEEE